MYKKIYSFLLCSLVLFNCVKPCIAQSSSRIITSFKVLEDSLTLFDKIRNRQIPVALYFPQTTKKLKNQPLIIVSHGYWQNKGGSNKTYTYIAKHLAKHGYFVASIQHELPNDDLIPTTGIPQVVRLPFWERGSDNILFVLNELKKTQPHLDYKHVVLIGHSNGGDMSILFAHKHPDLVDKVISLDSRRMPFPRTAQPKLYSLRSSDQVADEGVLPNLEEQKKYEITIIKLNNTIHNDMDDRANEVQRKEINEYIMLFLDRKIK